MIAPDARRLTRYAVVGALTLLVYLAVGSLVHWLGLPVVWQASPAFIAAVTVNYLLQRAWVFDDPRPARFSLPKYVLMIAVGYVINLLALIAFSPRLPLLLAQLTAVTLVVAWNAALSFSWVFLVSHESIRPSEPAGARPCRPGLTAPASSKRGVLIASDRIEKFGATLGVPGALTCIVLLLDATWLAVSGRSVTMRHFELSAVAIAILLAPLALGRYRNDVRVYATIRGAAVLIAFSIAGAILSYLVVSTGAPRVDGILTAWDQALGFDWPAAAAWVVDHPAIHAALHAAYFSWGPQLIVLVVFLGFTARSERLEEFLGLFTVTTVIVILVSGLFPADSVAKHYPIGSKVFDLSSITHFGPLRAGTMRDIPLDQSQGLVTIPSLHAAGALLLVYAMRGTRMLPPFLCLNAAMLASTPVSGSHYLVDVLAGVALAVVLVVVQRQLRLGRGVPLAASDSADPHLHQVLHPPAAAMPGHQLRQGQ